MFEKSKIRMRPEELGIELAQTLASTWFEKISSHVNEYKTKIAGVTESELESLWQLFLMLHCTAISVGVESSVENPTKKIVLDAFWNSVRDILREDVSEKAASDFEEATAAWYPQLREIMVEPSTAFGPGSLGPGKVLLGMALPNRDIQRHVKTIDDFKALPVQDRQQYLELVDELTAYFSSTLIALSQFATDCIKKTKFTKSWVVYE